MGNKLKSRKFWMAAAAFLGSIAASIAGLATENEAVATVGIVCGVASAAIYAAAEAYTDAAALRSSTVSITASTSAKEVVEKALGADIPKASDEK